MSVNIEELRNDSIGTIQFEGKFYTYEKEFWKPVETPDGIPSIKYIGPIVNGAIPDYVKIPCMPCYYRTFENLTELTKFPGIYDRTYETYWGCVNLQITEETVDSLKASLFGSVRKHICYSQKWYKVFRGCELDNVKPMGTVQDFLNVFGTYKLKLNQEQLKIGVSQFDSDVDTELSKIFSTLVKIGDLTDYFKEGEIYNQDLGRIVVKRISKASEIYDFISKQYVVFAITSRSFAVVVDYSGCLCLDGTNDTYIFLFNKDFICDIFESQLSKHFNVVLNNTKVSRTIILTEENNKIENHGNSYIICSEEGPGIECQGNIEIFGDGTLTIKSVGMHPAIGIRTHTGMSYGRWCPGSGCLDKITIRGVRVILESDVENFTVGKYGTAEIPEICLSEGGEFIAPEATGERVCIRTGGEELFGTTKRVDPAVYNIV